MACTSTNFTTCFSKFLCLAGIRVFAMVSKVDAIEDDKKAETQTKITKDLIETLNVESDRIFPIVNFLPSDRDESLDMKAVPYKQKFFVVKFWLPLPRQTGPKAHVPHFQNSGFTFHTLYAHCQVSFLSIK